MKRKGTTLTEEREVERRAKAEAERETEQARLAAMTFSEFWSREYFPQAEHDKATKTAKTEEQFFRLWIGPEIGEKTFSSIAPLDLERLKRTMTAKGKSPRTIHYCLAIIRQAFNLARIRGVFLGANPVKDVKKPTEDNRRMRFLSHEEAEKLLAALSERSKTLRDVALISLHCGLRAGEIFSLEWADIDLTRGQIFIRDPKSGRNRHAIMTAAVKAMLADRNQAGEAEGYVFRDRRHGGKIKEISAAFDKVVVALGFNEGVDDSRQRVVFHSLRHTYASWLVEAETNLYVVKELMGYRSIAMTERYSHVSNNTLKQAVIGLEARLSGGSK